MQQPGLDLETLEFTLESINEFARRELPDSLVIELDDRDEFPEELVREMCGEELGVQLLFIPEEYGGMGGSAFDVYRVCEAMARIDLGVATARAGHLPRQRPDHGRRHARSRRSTG